MIEVENYSPFPHVVFEKLGYGAKAFDVLALRGTFRLETDGFRSTPVEKQHPLVKVDTYWGDAETSSLKFETDLVIAKKRCDIHVIGHARTENGIPRRQWEVGVRIGRHTKVLRVTGPRYWEHSFTHWRLSTPEAVSEVPLRYELAFGGQYHEPSASEHAGIRAYRRNPIGCGHRDYRTLDPGRVYPAPQFESATIPDSMSNIQSRPAPEGLGPLSRWWEPRVSYAGTYDENWLRHRWPYLADDFDFAFYNSAHPDLQYDGYLEGDEPLSLMGLLPEAHVVTTALAAYIPICVVQDDACVMYRLMPRLDTLTIDTDARLIHHTWRLTLPREFAARHIVLGAIVPPPARPSAGQFVPLRLKKEVGRG